MPGADAQTGTPPKNNPTSTLLAPCSSTFWFGQHTARPDASLPNPTLQHLFDVARPSRRANETKRQPCEIRIPRCFWVLAVPFRLAQRSVITARLSSRCLLACCSTCPFPLPFPFAALPCVGPGAVGRGPWVRGCHHIHPHHPPAKQGLGTFHRLPFRWRRVVSVFRPPFVRAVPSTVWISSCLLLPSHSLAHIS